MAFCAQSRCALPLGDHLSAAHSQALAQDPPALKMLLALWLWRALAAGQGWGPCLGPHCCWGQWHLEGTQLEPMSTSSPGNTPGNTLFCSSLDQWCHHQDVLVPGMATM